MILPEIKERLDRLMSGGVDTDETLLDPLYAYSLINGARAAVLRADFVRYRRWSPQAQQTHYPVFDQYLQDSVCYTKFELPSAFIQAGTTSDGLIYFGSSSTKIFNTQSFRRIKSRTELADFLANPLFSPANGLYVGVLIEGLSVTVISKNTIRYPMVVGVFDDPTTLPEYSIQKDQYPMPEDMIPEMETYLLKTVIAPLSAKPADTLSDSRVTPLKR